MATLEAHVVGQKLQKMRMRANKIILKQTKKQNTNTSKNYQF